MDELTPGHILEVGLGFWPSKTLLRAVEMEVFTELAKHPEDLETLQGRLGLHSRSARDFFDALVALKFLERRDGRYYNTPSTDFFLDKRKPSYIGGVLEMANHRLYPFCSHLTTALRTGLPQNEIEEGGRNPFEARYAEPARLKEFLKAMTGVSRTSNLAIACKFPWSKYRVTVDVGTAQGDLITQGWLILILRELVLTCPRSDQSSRTMWRRMGFRDESNLFLVASWSSRYPKAM